MKNYYQQIITFSIYTTLITILLFLATTFTIAINDYNQYSYQQFNDTELGWDFKNNRKYGFNDCGIRDPLSCKEISNLKTKFKILFLGNSVVMGKELPTNQTFTKIFQKNFNHDNYSLNAGYDGYEIYREFYKVKRDLSKLGLTHVVWFMNRNDLRSKSTLMSIVQETKKSHGFNSSSHFLKILYSNFKNLRVLQISRQLVASYTETWLDSWKDKYYTNGIILQPDEPTINAINNEVSDFNSFLKGQNTKLIIVLIPSRTFSFFYSAEDALMFNEFFKQFRAQNIETHILIDPFNTRAPDFYFSDYVHLNKFGHSLVANALLDILNK